MNPVTEALNKAQYYQSQIALIDQQISNLIQLASNAVERGTNRFEMILETTPINGAQVHVVPVMEYPTAVPFGEVPPPPKELGYQRFYLPNEQGPEDIMSVTTSLPADLALATVDFMIYRLRAERKKLYEQSKSILKI